MYVVVVLCVLCVRACGHLTHCTHVWCCVCVCVRAQGYARHKLHEMGFARTPQMDRLLEQYPNDLETVVTALASSERGGGGATLPARTTARRWMCSPRSPAATERAIVWHR